MTNEWGREFIKQWYAVGLWVVGASTFMGGGE